MNTPLRRFAGYRSRHSCSGKRSDLIFGMRNFSTWIVATAVLIGVFCCAAHGQSMSVAGDGNGLWVLVPEADNSLKVLYRHISDPHDQLRVLKRLQGGHVASGGVASTEDSLWVIYKSTPSHPKSAVISIPSVGRVPRGSPPSQPKPALPAGVTVKAVAVNQSGPWVLLRVENLQTLKMLEASQPRITPTPTDPSVSKPPRRVESESVNEQRQPPATPDSPSEAEIPEPGQMIRVDRLVKLDHDQWVKVDLPKDWPHDAPSWLITRSDGDRFPILVTRPKLQNDSVIWAYEYDGSSWLKHAYSLRHPSGQAGNDEHSRNSQSPDGVWGPLDTAAAMAVLSVDDQLIFARVQRGEDRIDVDLSILRSGSAIPLDRFKIDCSPSGQWGLTRHGSTVAAVVMDEQRPLRWARMDLQGNLVTPETELSVPVPNPLSHTADYFVFVSVLVIATLIMFVVWHRDQTENRLKLPDNVELADLNRRIGAALIDFSPCLAATMVTFEIFPQDLFNHWPGRSGGWADMFPGALLIGLFVFHTTISELFTAKTLGKWLLGVRVTTLSGQSPDLWQVLVRGVMKVFDLIAWPLLILPLIGPYRQRLGDLVAKTVVVWSSVAKTDDQDPGSSQDPT